MRMMQFLLLGGCAHHFEPSYSPPVTPTDAGRLFQPDELRADVAALVAMVEDVHPAPFAVLDEADFRARRAALDATLTKPMGRLEFYRTVAPLVAALGDGHTTLQFWAPELEGMKDSHLLGVGVAVRDGALLYGGSLAPGLDVPPAGTPIVTIDGHPADQVYRDFLSYESGERIPFREDRVESDFYHLWWMTYGTAPSTTLTFADLEGVPRSLTVAGRDRAFRQAQGRGDLGCGLKEAGDLLGLEGDPWPERRAVVVESVVTGSGCEAAGVVVGDRVLAVGGEPLVHSSDASRLMFNGVNEGDVVEVEFAGPAGPVTRSLAALAAQEGGPWRRLDSPPGVQLVDLREMQDPVGFRRFLDETLVVMAAEGRKDLIVDLRENGGGNTDLIDVFCERVSKVPWTVYAREEATSNPRTWAYWDHYIRNDVPWSKRWLLRSAWLRPLRKQAVDGLFTQESTPGGRVSKAPFPGRVVLLTSRYTFSAAADFAAVMKDFGIATLVGEETGGLASSFGELYATALPNTALRLSISQKRFVRPSGQVDDRGVIPDLEVSSAGALDAALAWLAEPP